MYARNELCIYLVILNFMYTLSTQCFFPKHFEVKTQDKKVAANFIIYLVVELMYVAYLQKCCF